MKTLTELKTELLERGNEVRNLRITPHPKDKKVVTAHYDTWEVLPSNPYRIRFYWQDHHKIVLAD